jgi:hypothetical protein
MEVEDTTKETKCNNETLLGLFNSNEKLDLIYDMETNDPDDFFALCLLLSHPRSTLRGVTLYPGTSYIIHISY